MLYSPAPSPALQRWEWTHRIQRSLAESETSGH